MQEWHLLNTSEVGNENFNQLRRDLPLKESERQYK